MTRGKHVHGRAKPKTVAQVRRQRRKKAGRPAKVKR